MKQLIILLVLTGFLSSHAETIFDAQGFFPVVVQVLHKQDGRPVEGAKVRLQGLGKFVGSPDPDDQRKVIGAQLGKTVETDSRGLAVVMYHTRYGGTIDGDETVVTIPLKGTLTVHVADREIYSQKLSEWAEATHYHPATTSAPVIVVAVPK